MTRNDLGIFIGQSRTKVVLGKTKYKVRNKHIPTCDAPEHVKCGMILQDRDGDTPELSEFEKLYKEFCEKAYKHILLHPSVQGENHPVGVLFPDFNYEIVPQRLPIE